MVRRLELARWDKAERAEETPAVEPVDPLQRRVLDGVDVAPRPRRRTTSVLYNPITVSARALSAIVLKAELDNWPAAPRLNEIPGFGPFATLHGAGARLEAAEAPGYFGRAPSRDARRSFQP